MRPLRSRLLRRLLPAGLLVVCFAVGVELEFRYSLRAQATPAIEAGIDWFYQRIDWLTEQVENLPDLALDDFAPYDLSPSAPTRLSGKVMRVSDERHLHPAGER
ncbi:MAG: hypothetical protein O3A63_02870 [Proteobacteria bacterium]|nr:hypothetical protein [Pseudomonadota bacterium]